MTDSLKTMSQNTHEKELDIAETVSSLENIFGWNNDSDAHLAEYGTHESASEEEDFANLMAEAQAAINEIIPQKSDNTAREKTHRQKTTPKTAAKLLSEQTAADRKASVRRTEEPNVQQESLYHIVQAEMQKRQRKVAELNVQKEDAERAHQNAARQLQKQLSTMQLLKEDLTAQSEMSVAERQQRMALEKFYQTEVAFLEKNARKMRSNVAALQQQRDEAVCRVKALEKQSLRVDQLKKDLEHANNKCAELQAQLATISTLPQRVQAESGQSDFESIGHAKKRCKSDLCRAAKLAKQYAADCQQLQSDLEHSKQQHGKHSAQYKSIKRQCAAARAALKAQVSKTKALSQNLAQCTDELSEMSEMEPNDNFEQRRRNVDTFF